MNIRVSSPLEPTLGVRSLGRGLLLLLAPGLRRYVWLPIFVNIVVYSLGFWAAGHYFDAAMDWFLPQWLEWLRWLLWPLLALSLIVIAFFSFTVIANLLGSPFYGALAEQVVRMQGGSVNHRSSSDNRLVRDLANSIASETQRLRYLLLRVVPILLMFPIPGINVLASLLWMGLGAWTMALEYCAYPLELDGLKFADQRQFLATRRIEVLGFGAAVMLGLAIPVLNILIPPAAVIGATLYCQARRHA